MIGVLTGDIISSRTKLANEWQPVLTRILNQYGKEPNDWELFRGDSFQIRVAPEGALKAAIHIKAGMRQVPPLDVRIAIGVGTEEHAANKITSAAGSAFILSGECFDALRKQTLGIAIGNKKLDEVLNLMLSLAALTIDNWSPTVAEVIKMAIEHPEMNQEGIANKMGKSQSSISEALKRGGYDAVMRMEHFYKQQIGRL
ncbi:SatD family protein [Parapedobacter koreensis]|uniref:SatD family (SatD) n=1 Tax=Parapedobacter koreensis TaxID=332977 RepID=A0A1H7UGE7_9SPHI|nr:SatD family protein [Parapedobacter koreensis]SEL96130.1 SatD family (SatD) [Parapedobacter koreensis]